MLHIASQNKKHTYLHNLFSINLHSIMNYSINVQKFKKFKYKIILKFENLYSFENAREFPITIQNACLS